MRSFLVVASVCSLVLGSNLARAADVAPREPDLEKPLGGNLEVKPATAEALDLVASREATWAWSWRAIFAGAAIGEGALTLATSSRADRIDLASGSFKAVVALGATFVFPLASSRDWRSKCERSEAEVSDYAANELLDRAADKEAEGRAWPMHLLNVAFNAGVGVAAGEWSGRWSTAILGTVAGIAVGELELFTQPTTAIDERARVSVVASPTYLGLAGTF